jgi:hypothetical protein
LKILKAAALLHDVEGDVDFREEHQLAAASFAAELLEREGYEVRGDPMLARYNPPLTPWFLRRNEILVEVSPRS